MRPLRLELEGFTSFRERAVIDFEDADLFVLSGPMGAGKSSVIDAMGFALYGSIARFHSKSLVAPVISQGLQEAKVRLDFRLGDHEYTAIRIVRRSKTGSASTPEARLIQGEKLIAGNAEDASAAVERLIGLSFDQFTKCVVLPQGDFADLLHAKPADRQELLVRLLDIGLYRKVGERARGRASRGEGALAQLKSRLENDLRDITQQAYDEQEKRVAVLAGLVEHLESEDRALREVSTLADGHRAAADKAGQLIAVLEAVKIPAGVDDLVGKLEKAVAAEAAALGREQQAAAEVEALEKQRAELPDPAVIEATINAYKERAAIAERIAAANKTLATAKVKLEAAEQAAVAARAVVEAAETERARLERADSAYHASRGLKAGDVCPVCGETLSAAPALDLPTGVAEAEAAVAAASKQLQQIEAENTRTRNGVIQLSSAVQQESQRLQAIEKQLDGRPSEKEAAALLQKVLKADSDLGSARQTEKNLRLMHQKAQSDLDLVKREEQQAWARLYTAREPVAAAGAPPAEETLGGSWQALFAWSQATAGEQRILQDQARLEEQALRAQEQELLARQAALCEEAGVPANGRSFRDAAVDARGRAEQALQHIDERLSERVGVEKELESTTKATATAKLLGTHLNATHFERWYLQEAMARLVRGATERMRDLTDGQYSIDVSSGGADFVVVDHLNANEKRPVRTLSGGETFLASLALALALGDDIASLAAKGSSRLDALFLDEGFGALDQSTLETVSSTIEELGARGRMVGIITHVQELAERVPVQFRVSKVNGTSQVERVQRS